YLGQTFKDVVEIETNWFSQQETLQTELRVIKSYSQAQAVANALCQRRLPDGTPLLKRVLASHLPDASCDSPTQVPRAATVLALQMRADPVPQSRLVNLVASLNDAEMAALLANTAAQVYTDRTLERRLSQSVGAATWLSDEFSDLTAQLNEAEGKLIEFKRKNNVVAVAIEDQQNDLTSKHKKLADELNAVEVKLNALLAQPQPY